MTKENIIICLENAAAHSFELEWPFKEYPIINDFIETTTFSDELKAELRATPAPAKSHFHSSDMLEWIGNHGMVVSSRTWSREGLVVYCKWDS